MKVSALALDLATTTGWAWWSEGMPRPFFGAFRLPAKPGEVGPPALALERWLMKLFLQSCERGAPITHWFFEAQHIDSRINIDTVYRLIALGGMVEKVAHQLKPKSQPKAYVFKVLIQQWRKHFLGRGAGFKKDPDNKAKYLPGEDPKEIAIQRCAEFGWHTDIADAAEACAILDYGLSCISDDLKYRPWRDDTLMKTQERV